tara:strand:+ start:156 stop:311 length:156 start_codon:yes stop_codon:yes gene_type:complete
MTYQITRTLSKSGKRTMFFPTINGKRITRTNFLRKWEAERLGKLAVDHFSK